MRALWPLLTTTLRGLFPSPLLLEESLLVGDALSALGVVFRGVGPKNKAAIVVGSDDGGPLFVTVAVEGSGDVAVDAGFVEQVESDMAKEREQPLLLIFRQAGCDHRHDGVD